MRWWRRASERARATLVTGSVLTSAGGAALAVTAFADVEQRAFEVACAARVLATCGVDMALAVLASLA